MTHLSWAQWVCSLAQDDAGVQRTVMPAAWGGSTWAFDWPTKGDA